MSASGGVVAAWEGESDSESLVGVAIAPAGGPFRAPKVLARSESGVRVDRLFVLSDGTAIVFFVADGTRSRSSGRLHVATRPPGGQFGAPDLLTRDDLVLARKPSYAIAPDGTIAVAWAEMPFDDDRPNRPPNRLYLAIRPPGGPLSAPIEVAEGVGVDQLGVAIGRNRTTTVLWKRPRGVTSRYEVDMSDLNASTRTAAGIFSAPELVSAAVPGAYTGTLAAARSGELGALWAAASPGGARFEAAFRPPGASFRPAQMLSDGGGRYSQARETKLEFDGDGRAVALFSRLPRSQDIAAVLGAVRPPGGRFGPTRPLGLAGFYSLLQTSLTRRGAFVALWSPAVAHYTPPDLIQQTVTNQNVVGAAAEPGREFGPAKRVERGAVGPVLGVGDGPSTLAAWTRADGLRVGVRNKRTGRFCAQTVAPRPGTTSLLDQGMPAALASDRRGNATVIFAGNAGLEALFATAGRVRPVIRRVSARGRAPTAGSGALGRSIVLRFSLSEAARVRATLSRTRGTRYRRIGSIAYAGHAGKNEIVIPDRIGRRRLRRGRYQVKLSATDCDRLRAKRRRAAKFTR